MNCHGSLFCILFNGPPRGYSGKESPANTGDARKRRRFALWAGNVLWRRKRQHSSILTWRLPQTEEPGGLPSMGGKESETAESSQLTAASSLIEAVQAGGLVLGQPAHVICGSY